MALPPLIFKIGAETDDLTKGLTGAQAAIAKFAKVGVAAAGAVGVAMIALTKQSMAQVDAQAKLAQSMGTTVRSMQTLEQAGKLAGVAMSGVQQATGDLTRRLAQAASGTGPVADALDRLGLSAVALSNIPLDERVLKINEALNAMVPAAERAAVAGQLFGEEGSLAMARIDTATIRQAREDILRFGVAVSEVGANNIESANDAVTRLGLVMTGLGNQMATIAAPGIERFATGLVDVAARIMGVKVSLDEYFATFEQARAVLGEGAFNKLIGKPEEIIRAADALDAVSVETQRFTGIATNLETQIRGLASGLEQIDQAGAASAVQNIADQARILRERFDAGQISVEEFIEGMRALETRATTVAETVARVNDIDLSGIVGRIQAMGTALANAAAEAVNLTASLPGATSTQIGPSARRGTRAGTTGLAPSTSLRPQLPGVDFGEDPDAGGGAGTDPNAALREQMATRLETLMEGLMTERETVAQWYAEGQALIDNATDAELAAIGGKQAAIERLADEHQKRLSRIRELGAAADLQTVLGAGAEILGAIGQTNDKALKMAKVFGAAEALVNAYRSASQTLADPSLPFFAKFAAAASVLAQGIGFVTAIKGVNKSGGAVASTGGASAAASAPQAQAAPQATQTLNFSVTSDPFGISDRLVRQIVGAINQSQRDGSTLIRATVS